MIYSVTKADGGGYNILKEENTSGCGFHATEKEIFEAFQKVADYERRMGEIRELALQLKDNLQPSGFASFMAGQLLELCDTTPPTEPVVAKNATSEPEPHYCSIKSGVRNCTQMCKEDVNKCDDFGTREPDPLADISNRLKVIEDYYYNECCVLPDQRKPTPLTDLTKRVELLEDVMVNMVNSLHNYRGGKR